MSGFIGKATHYKPRLDVYCGRVGVSYKTNRPAKVDCLQCLAAMRVRNSSAARHVSELPTRDCAAVILSGLAHD